MLLYGWICHPSIDDAVSSGVHGPHRPADGVECHPNTQQDEQSDEEYCCEIVRAIFGQVAQCIIDQQLKVALRLPWVFKVALENVCVHACVRVRVHFTCYTSCVQVPVISTPLHDFRR